MRLRERRQYHSHKATGIETMGKVNTVSIIAICHDCDWLCEENAVGTYHSAYMHARTKRHNVSVETASSKHYFYKKGAEK
jgi:hypothetical protein